MMQPDWFGYIAATLTTLAFAPQVLLTLKTRDVKGISLPMYAVFSLGVLLWLVYGVLIRSWPVIGANAVTLLLTLIILTLKIRYRA